MKLLTIGLNHHSAPLDLRSRFAFTLEQLKPSLQGLQQAWQREAHHPEVALLSTCNRTELYCAADTELRRPAVEWLAGMGGVTVRTLMDHAYVLEGGASARHAFRVASGLDSMVLGEPQILGQMKRAMGEASGAGTLGSTLHQLFQRAFFVAKAVRSNTEIGHHSVSLAAACGRLAIDMFGDLGKRSVLFVGAGEMIESVASHLVAHAPRRMVVANRSLQRGQVLAARVGAEGVGLHELPARLAEADLVIAGTASGGPLISAEMVAQALRGREGRPMMLIDLAVPRDIAAEVGELPSARLVCVDDLTGLVALAGHKRQAAVHRAEMLVDTGVRQFEGWLTQRGAVPLIQAIHAQTNQWRDAELLRARRALARGDDIEGVLEAMARGLTRKMLHGALTQLRNQPTSRASDMVGTVSRLFLSCPVRNTRLSTAFLQDATATSDPPLAVPADLGQAGHRGAQ